MLKYMVIDYDIFDHSTAVFKDDLETAKEYAESMARSDLILEVEFYERLEVLGGQRIYQMVKRYK